MGGGGLRGGSGLVSGGGIRLPDVGGGGGSGCGCCTGMRLPGGGAGSAQPFETKNVATPAEATSSLRRVSFCMGPSVHRTKGPL